MIVAAMDTHDGSGDTVDCFRGCFENVSLREGVVTTDAKHDDQLSKVKVLSFVNILLRKSIRESDEYRLL
jgi:hypothetical protein